MRKRIDRAKAQLADRAIPLKAIAAACGFSDQSHMTRLFRPGDGHDAGGISPGENGVNRLGARRPSKS